MIKVTV